MMRLLLLFLAAAVAPLFSTASAEGDLAIKAEKLTLRLGSQKSDYAMEPKQFRLTTGKAYRLEIISQGFKDYELEAEDFFRNVWLRKIEIGDITLDVSTLNAIEFEAGYEETEAEITFVPIRNGEFNFAIEGLEKKGMVGKFIVE